MSRSSGKGIEVVLVLGGVGLLGGIALLMMVVWPRGGHVQSCAELAEFVVPRLEVVDETLDRKLGAWPGSHEEISEVYSALARDLRNPRLISLPDGDVGSDGYRIARAFEATGERIRLRTGSLESTEKLEASVVRLATTVDAARRRCQ